MRSVQETRRGTLLAATLLVGILATCAREQGDVGSVEVMPGIVQIYLTDAPADYDNVWVTVDDLAVHRSGAPWESVPLIGGSTDTNGDGLDDVISNPDGSVTVDLIALRGVETLFGTGIVDAGHYTQLRLRVLHAEAMQGGVPIPLEVPSGAQTGVKIVGQFRVDPGEAVTLLLDFDAEASIVPRGGSGQPPILNPVIKIVVRPGCDGSGADTAEYFSETIPLPSCRVTYVLDRSGSMAYQFGDQPWPSRWDVVRDETIASIQGLPEAARFNIVTYACNRDSWSTQTRFATPANTADAEAWLLGHFPWGGTGTGPGGAEALADKEVRTVLLATDGQPNCGAAGTAGHLQMILDANTQGAAVHTFGIAASGIFREFLIDIAASTGGIYKDI